MTYGTPFTFLRKTGRTGVSGTEWVVRDRYGFTRTLWVTR